MFVTFLSQNGLFCFCPLPGACWCVKATMASTWDLYDSYCSAAPVGQTSLAADGEKPSCTEVISSHRLDSSTAPHMSTSATSSASLGEAQ